MCINIYVLDLFFFYFRIEINTDCGMQPRKVDTSDPNYKSRNSVFG